MGLASFTGAVLYTVVGVFSLNFFVLGAVTSGAFTKSVSKKKKEARLQARSELWDLSLQPLPGFHHKFYKADDGVDLHYVEGGNTSPDAPLIIFIHGFPDSWFIWHHQLSSPAIQLKAHLIAVDLPGFGGSDIHKVASPNNVLTTITNFIIAQKEKRATDNCTLVTHDWGSLIGFRLASEVGFLFKRCIIMSALHPAIARENKDRATSSASKMLQTYIRNPTNLALIRSALHALKPLLRQLRSSFYIPVFLLPRPLARQLVMMGDSWFPRMCSKLAKVQNEEIYLASVYGPSKSEAEGYPESIMLRANPKERANGMIAYYREGLATDKWDKPENIQLLAAAAEATNSGFTGLLERKKGAFGCPVTAIWGGKDSAFHRPFCFEGFEDYLYPSKGKGEKSYLLCFPHAGHWPMTPSPSREALDMLIEGALDGSEGETLRGKVWAADKDVKFEIEK